MANAPPISPQPAQILFDEPFTYEDADLIIHSSDDHHFRLHKQVLALTSPYFCDIFTRWYGGAADDETQDLTLSEDHHGIKRLLDMCYRCSSKAGKCGYVDARTVTEMAIMAQKYDMQGVISCLLETAHACKLFEKSALWMFIMAAKLNRRKEIRLAAQHLLADSEYEILNDMDYLKTGLPDNPLGRIAAPMFFDLIQYRRMCATLRHHSSQIFHGQSERYLLD